MQLDIHATERDLAVAADRLAHRAGSVALGGMLVLRATETRLACAVIDPEPAARRCEHEYEVLVENAMRALDASGLRDRLPELRQEWFVVADADDTAEVLWRSA